MINIIQIRYIEINGIISIIIVGFIESLVRSSIKFKKDIFWTFTDTIRIKVQNDI